MTVRLGWTSPTARAMEAGLAAACRAPAMWADGGGYPGLMGGAGRGDESGGGSGRRGRQWGGAAVMMTPAVIEYERRGGDGNRAPGRMQ